jgi:ureidoglycolate hydrolase|tara:strand:- start:983 stop:1198 length:216 start_codon:yes stop_codon:yes gene_type:complete
MNKKELEIKVDELTVENNQLKEMVELFKAENAKQLLQLQMLERYANGVMQFSNALIQEVEALNNATSSETQ